jgi:multidrug efflux pump subunit AcrA (membrane-fusion protein)
MNEKLKKALVMFIAIIFLLLFLQIIRKIIMLSGKPKEIVFEVSTEKLKLTDLIEKIKFEGVVEGDPQIKVYSQVPGKFEKNAVAEGDSVKKDDCIAYINRDIVGFDYKLAPVKSPINGIVTKLFFVDKGDAVLPQLPVAEVSNIDNIKVVVTTGERDLNKIKKGLIAKINAEYDESIAVSGNVFSVTPFVNKDTLAGSVIIKAENKEHKLKPGMSVKIEIETEMRKTFFIPEKAILTDEQGQYIFINENGIAKKINVKTGYQENDYMEITGDLKEGTEIVTEGSFKLFEGAKLNIINKELK